MQELRTWMYFVPITIRARYFLMFLAGLSVFGTIIPFDNVAHAAHLGGIVTGIAFVHWGSKFSQWVDRLQVPRRRKNEPPTLARSQPWRTRAARREQAVASDEFISQKVDPILDKIAAQGIQSLTDAERKVLEAARKKMDKR